MRGCVSINDAFMEFQSRVGASDVTAQYGLVVEEEDEDEEEGRSRRTRRTRRGRRIRWGEVFGLAGKVRGWYDRPLPRLA